MAIHNDLVAAYTGYYEDEMFDEKFHRIEDPVERLKWVEARIKRDRPKERLLVYLEWNGILGYHGRIWEISQGEFES